MTSTRVTAGVDGSPAAEAAIRWAAREAASRGAELRLVHAFVWPMFEAPLGAGDMAPGLRAAADRIVAESTEVAQKFEPDVTVDSGTVDGFPSPVLIEASQHAALLVIDTRELGVTVGPLVGSTGLDLAANAHCPVVVVRPDRAGEAGTRVVVGYDGSPASAVALDFGLDYAQRHELTVRVVTAQPLYTDRDRIAQSYLESEVHSRAGGKDAELVHVEGHPADQLLRLSADAELIVVGSRGRGGFAGMLLGSVSQAVLQHARCPVAVIPPAVAARTVSRAG
jgi:nucleotide-binding universal stress UspA family protein